MYKAVWSLWKALRCSSERSYKTGLLLKHIWTRRKNPLNDNIVLLLLLLFIEDSRTLWQSQLQSLVSACLHTYVRVHIYIFNTHPANVWNKHWFIFLHVCVLIVECCVSQHLKLLFFSSPLHAACPSMLSDLEGTAYTVTDVSFIKGVPAAWQKGLTPSSCLEGRGAC